MSQIRESDISVNDVYDFAYDIAQDFEKIVFSYGIDKLKPVIDKVINVLEILESSVKKIEQISAELDELKSNNFHLTSEKIVSDHEKTKLKQIYEESEESWLAEVLKLKSELASVKSENEILKNHLALNKENSSKLDDTSKVTIQDQENTILRLHRTLKQRDRQIQENICSIKTLNTRVQELLEMNKVLHLKNQEAKRDIGKLVIEKNDYKSELILQKRENLLLNESIDELVNSCLRTERGSQVLFGESDEQMNKESVIEDINYRGKQELNLLRKIQRLQSELQLARSKSQNEENTSKLSSEEKMPFSKIHQLFHLFLGVTALSEFCWC